MCSPACAQRPGMTKQNFRGGRAARNARAAPSRTRRAMRGVTPALSACRRPLHRRLAESGKPTASPRRSPETQFKLTGTCSISVARSRMAPRDGLPRDSICKKLDCQPSVTADTDAKSVSCALANRQPQPGEKHRPSAPRIKVVAEKDGKVQITSDHHPEPTIDQVLLMKELGTADIDFLDGLLGQLADIGTQGRKLE